MLPPRKNKNKVPPEETVYEAHGKWVRTRYGCAVSGCCTGDKIQAAHVDVFLAEDPRDDIPYEDRKGTSTKNAWWMIPMCVSHHRECHKGARTFYQKYRLDPHKMAKQLWSLSPHRIRMEKVKRGGINDDE